MKHEYEYDDSGLASSYLGLATLLPVTLYLTYKKFRTRAHTKRYPCMCTHCTKHPAKVQGSTAITLWVVFLWIVLSVLLKNVLTLKLEYKSSYFNPYRVLDIDENAAMPAIKKAFRKKVASLDPTTAAEEDKKDITEKLKEVTRAFNFFKENKNKTIVNETTYEVVAIPQWMIDRGYFVIVIYGVILGLYLPQWAFKKWRAHVLKNRYGVYYETADAFYGAQETATREVRTLISLIAGSRDFQDRKWKSGDLTVLKRSIEDDFGIPLKETSRADQGYYVLMDHLFRTRKADTADLEFVQTKSIAIINSFKEIALHKSFLGLFNTLLMLERMVVQAVFDPEFAAMQFPENSFEKVFLKNKKAGELEYKNTQPHMVIKNLRAFVERTELMVSDSRKVDKEVYEVPRDSKVTVAFELETDGTELVHAPFMQREVRLLWSVFVVVDDRVLDEVITVANNAEQKALTFVFDSAEDVAQSRVTVHVKSGSYFGADHEASVVLRYLK